MASRFNQLVKVRGTNVVFHREDFSTPCPCRTPEGYRDPLWHLNNPSAPECNEQGLLPGTTTELIIKAMVQPLMSARISRNLQNFIDEVFGAVKTNDHLGFFPLDWNGTPLNFDNWSRAGEDWIQYNNQKFTVVGFAIIPDPKDGSPTHHIECALRLISER